MYLRRIRLAKRSKSFKRLRLIRPSFVASVGMNCSSVSCLSDRFLICCCVTPLLFESVFYVSPFFLCFLFRFLSILFRVVSTLFLVSEEAEETHIEYLEQFSNDCRK